MSFKHSFILSNKVSSKPSIDEAKKITKDFITSLVTSVKSVDPTWGCTMDVNLEISEAGNEFLIERTFHFIGNKDVPEAKTQLVDLMCSFVSDKTNFTLVQKTDFGCFPLNNTKENNQDSVRKISIDKKGNHFDHLYDRDHQIKIVLSAIRAGIDSNFENRYHCVLYGDPACGKSDILKSVGNMLGNEGEAYLKLDATSTTKAGAQKIFLDPTFKIPNILIIEEIEKQKEEHFQWLLGLLDDRAEIRKNTARENFQRSAKVICLATVNNMTLFKKQMSGALHSRFPNKIYCPRPDRSILKKILTRELEKNGGNPAWIEPALAFCVDKMGWNDPREIIPVCICGGDSLLDGSYQASILATQCPTSKAA